jgi:cytochrome bd-type quinol oxidase subunit 2
MENHYLLGSIWLFTHIYPWLVTCLVVVFSTGAILFIRWRTEGRVYDKALSSTPGDLFLAIYCGLIAYICQQGVPPGLHLQLWWHCVLLLAWPVLATFLMGFALRQSEASRRFTLRPANTYHNLVVVPVLGYLVSSTLPILWPHEGYLDLQFCAYTCLLIWVALLAWDITHDNLVQEK